MYRFGLFCSLSDNSLSTNRTINLKNLKYENIEKKLLQNAEELVKLLDYCEDKDFKVFRLGNSFIPFLSHNLFEDSWLEKIKPILKDTKEKISKYNTRITIHPGQYTVLNSTNDMVVKNSLRELERVFWLFDQLGINNEGTVLIHGGGAYGDKTSAIERLIKTIEENPWLKKRLALENDEKVYTANEILNICNFCSIPMVFDIYHHTLNPSEFEAKDILKTWGNKRPKVHLSSKGEGRFGKHGDEIFLKDFIELKNMFKEATKEIDIMVEAKNKEFAIKNLRKEILENNE
ncbi:UV DNA damage repair endonuclease UvsE [Halarcobacter sp.]|uniref:UV DNA damage repair endonuclease UvsE n=1 Tax=Halarcobacter sp. TaxID=2321133 RepID=UPI002AA7C985|nr:UV DNA damage repair endonuclease UvsE [Halarcobacter sp.]